MEAGSANHFIQVGSHAVQCNRYQRFPFSSINQNMPNRATLKDIAHETGFSIMTVSQVLNGKENHASEKNRQLIRDVASRLNYLPNLNARRLVTSKNNIIGLLIDYKAPSFHQEVMIHLEELTVASGRRLQIGMSHDDFKSLSSYIDDFRGNGISSVICLGHSYPAFGFKIPPLLEPFDRVVFLEKPSTASRFPYVAVDHFQNFYVLTAAMLRKGFRRIVSIRANYQDSAFCEARNGMAKAYEDAKLPFEEDFWCVAPTDGNLSQEDAAINLRMGLLQKPDVLILSNDISVLRTQRLLSQQGIRVPNDIALFSASQSNLAEISSPTISGIDYNAQRLADSLFKTLLKGNDASNFEGLNQLIPSILNWRESCPLQ